MVELKNQLDAPLGQLAAALGRATTPTPQNVRGRCSSPLRDLPAEGVADLLGQAAKARPFTIHHSINGSFAIRRGKWKLALCPGSGGWSAPKPAAAKK